MTELLQMKTKLIAQYLLPVLGSLPAASGLALTERLVTNSQLRQAVARQYLDEPGQADSGQAVVLPQSVAHSFQPVDGTDGMRYTGTHIWARRTLIFDPYALLDGLDRPDFVQALEPTPYLSIQYPVLRHIIADYNIVDRAILVLARKQEHQRRLHDHLLRLTPQERVAAFEARYQSFAHVATIEQRCMHVSARPSTYFLIN